MKYKILKIRYILLQFIVLVSVTFVRCNKEEPIPSYIHIDRINLSTVYSNQGSSSHKIIDAWIYIDDILIGAFEMPCTIPVLYEGNHILKVVPGVKENGISETRIMYPFYDRYQQTITLTPGQITTITPTTTYAQSADFSWIEDFEGSSHSICDTINSDTIMKIITAPIDVFELTGSGGVFLDGVKNAYVGVTCNQYVLPQAGAAVFLELNYNCNTNFNVGIVGYNSTGGITVQSISLTLRPTSSWNKVYVNLSTEITNAPGSAKFALFFSMLKDPALSTSYFYLDNVKLVN